MDKNSSTSNDENDLTYVGSLDEKYIIGRLDKMNIDKLSTTAPARMCKHNFNCKDIKKKEVEDKKEDDDNSDSSIFVIEL